MKKDEQTYRLKGIPLINQIGYGSGNFGFGVVFQVITSYLVFYATAVLAVPGSLVGIAVSISVVWDGITDPIMGYISDVTQFKRFGRRHLYLLIGTLATCVFNYLMWVINPDMPTIFKFLWILVDIMILKTFMTIYATPYTALGAELSADYNERTSIQAIKTIFFLFGLLFGSVMGMLLFFKPTAAFPIGQLNPDAYRNIGLTSSLFMLVFGLISFLSTGRYIPFLPGRLKNPSNAAGKDFANLFRSFLLALNNRDFKFVLLGYLFTNISSALVITLGLHVFTYTFGMDNYSIGIVIGTLFITSILSQPLWIAISKGIDKKPSVMLGLVCSLIGCVFFIFLVLLRDTVNTGYLYMIPFAVLVGFGTGGLFSLPPSMVADTIDIEEHKTGRRSEGMYYGCFTFGYKVSQSIAIFFLGVMLDAIGFNPDLPVQTDATTLTLGMVLPVGSIASLTAALLCYRKYAIDKNKIDSIQRQILYKGKGTDSELYHLSAADRGFENA